MHLNQTVCNRKLDYHDSCTLRKGSAMYPRLVILSLAKRLEKPPFCHSYTFFGAWTRDHYMPLQRPTTRVFMLCYGFLNKRSPLAVQRFPTQMSPLPPCGSANSQSTSQSMMPFPTQPSKTHYPYTTGKRHSFLGFFMFQGVDVHNQKYVPRLKNQCT
jgi:hypothetical protein